MNYSKGISWFDDCRIPFVNEDSKINFDRPRTRKSVNDEWVLKQAHDYTNPEYKEYNKQGRFPPNLLVCDDMLNDGSVSKGSDHKISYREYNNFNKDTFSLPKYRREAGYDDKGTNSRYYDLDKWFDKMINEL